MFMTPEFSTEFESHPLHGEKFKNVSISEQKFKKIFYPAHSKLPEGKNFGRIRVNYVKVYHTPLKKFLKAHRESDDNPELFLDLESPKEGFKVQKETELHLGINARFRIHSLDLSQTVKDHIDIYIPVSELPRLITILNRIKEFVDLGVME